MGFKVIANEGSRVSKIATKINKRGVIKLLNKSYMFIGDGKTILEWNKGEEDKFIGNLQQAIDRLKEVKKQNSCVIKEQ